KSQPAPDSPAGNGTSTRDACTPGAFSCSPDARAWQVCGISRAWIRVADCGPDRACQFNDANDSPYCVVQKA
ncbi:hypothetical protein E4U41_001570, partial [Claviceps citrina]